VDTQFDARTYDGSGSGGSTRIRSRALYGFGTKTASSGGKRGRSPCQLSFLCDAEAGSPPTRQGISPSPEEDDSQPAKKGSEGRRCKILQSRVPTRREMLEVLQHPSVNPKPTDDPKAASVQSVTGHCDRDRNRIGSEVFKLPRKASSGYIPAPATMTGSRVRQRSPKSGDEATI
jgi:hypothetical protein